MARSMASGLFSIILGGGAAFCVAAGSHSGGKMFGFLNEPWTWGYAAPWMIASIVLGWLASTVGKKTVVEAQAKEIAEALGDDSPYALLLRPFAVDDKLVVANPKHSELLLFPGHYYEQEEIPLERLLAESLRSSIQLRVIGGDPTGPGVMAPSNSEWRERFLLWAHAARGIIMLLLPGTEIPWELRQLRLQNWLYKSVFILPPRTMSAGSSPMEELAFEASLLREGLTLPSRSEQFQFFRLTSSSTYATDVACLSTLSHRRVGKVLLRYFPEIASQSHNT